MSMIEFPRSWYSVTASALTSIRETWPVRKLESMAMDGHETPVCGDALGESIAFEKWNAQRYSRVMNAYCECGPLPKLTSIELAMLAKATGKEVVHFHRTRHEGTKVVKNEFTDLLVRGEVKRGHRVELSCGAAIGLPSDRFGV